ncbi:hypothetical protein PBI_GRAYSON_27 [Rhodococcus phage Grayson]|nr:hypothetical protein PBI_GRAYSON_27 [Rhodococcus phage Grayson]
MPLFLGSTRHPQTQESLDFAAASMPVYFPHVCFWQNFFTDASNKYFKIALGVGPVLIPLGIIFNLYFLMVLAAAMILVSATRNLIYQKLRNRDWGVGSSEELKIANTYLRLPKSIKRELKPLAKASYKEKCDDGHYTKMFDELMLDYYEEYPPLPESDELGRLYESHRFFLDSLKELKKEIPK